MTFKEWTRNELLAAFNLYSRTTFGRLHKGNPDIIALSKRIGRTPSAVAMKLVNFASLDPIQQARKIKGLRNASRADRRVWDEFNRNPEKFAFESQKALRDFIQDQANLTESDISIPSGSTETVRSVRARLVQGFFRDAVLSSYEYECAICTYDIREFLTASHIIPWRSNVALRADPRNGLALCVLHDQAFDRGLMAIGDKYNVILATCIKSRSLENPLHSVAFLALEGKAIALPKRFAPDSKALAYHRKNIFRG